jgi:hypothetical protein
LEVGAGRLDGFGEVGAGRLDGFAGGGGGGWMVLRGMVWEWMVEKKNCIFVFEIFCFIFKVTNLFGFFFFLGVPFVLLLLLLLQQQQQQKRGP